MRRDVDMLLESCHVKARLLTDLRQAIQHHRLDDVAQLREARRQVWPQWDERLKRVEEWMASAAGLAHSSANLRVWRDSAIGFNRMRRLSQKFGQLLEKRSARLDRKLLALSERMQAWSERLMVMESDIRGFMERQAAKDAEIVVSRARKQPYLDFVYREREEEGRLSSELKSIRFATNKTLERFASAEKWAADSAQAYPEQFEDGKEELSAFWRPFQKRFGELRELALHQALNFEEGRRRLRWVYEQVQHVRVVQNQNLLGQRPLWERLFRPDA
jgi:hypothetical protein